MIIQVDGSMVFTDIFDLTYNILNAIGLSIDNYGYIKDQDSGIHLEFQGRKLKATVNPSIPCYAGQGEVLFDPLGNTRQMHTLLGYAIDKETMTNPNFRCISHYINDSATSPLTSMTLKMADGSLRSTKLYQNRCLKFISAIFLIYEDNVDLSNFDV